MAVHAHAQHRDAADERVRLARLARHEREVRDRERARERRRITATLMVPVPVEDPTGFAPGCVI
jgi:hypothetical protein